MNLFLLNRKMSSFTIIVKYQRVLLGTFTSKIFLAVDLQKLFIKIKLNQYSVSILLLGPTFWKYKVLYHRYFLPSPLQNFIRWTVLIFFNYCKISLEKYVALLRIREKNNSLMVRAVGGEALDVKLSSGFGGCQQQRGSSTSAAVEDDRAQGQEGRQQWTWRIRMDI